MRTGFLDRRPDPTSDPPASGGSFFDRAVREARAGHYETALVLLDSLTQARGLPDPEALHLRAKVYAQLGQLLDAERCWIMAEKADPGNPVYALAIGRLRQAHRNQFGVRSFGHIALAGIIVLVVLVAQGIQNAAHRLDLEDHMASASAASAAQWGDLRERQEDLASVNARALDNVRDMVSTFSSRLDAGLSGLTRDADMTARLDALSAQLQGLTEAAKAGSREDLAAREQDRQTFAQFGEHIDGLREQMDARLPPPDTDTAPMLAPNTADRH
jgi:hypothetical protein